MSAEAIAASAGVAALLAAWQRCVVRREASRRALAFADCDKLLSDSALVDTGTDYPRLQGHYGGLRVEIQPLLDHVGFRKVPSVWMAVTAHAQLPLGGSFDVLMRPRNIEFYAASSRLEQRIDLPAGWPVDHLAKVSPAGWEPPLETLRAAAADWLQEPTLKELLVTPRGLRLVVRLGGVDRGSYLVLRSLRPESDRVPRALLQSVLDGALRIARAVRDDASASKELP